MTGGAAPPEQLYGRSDDHADQGSYVAHNLMQECRTLGCNRRPPGCTHTAPISRLFRLGQSINRKCWFSWRDGGQGCTAPSPSPAAPHTAAHPRPSPCTCILTHVIRIPNTVSLAYSTQDKPVSVPSRYYIRSVSEIARLLYTRVPPCPSNLAEANWQLKGPARQA